MKASPHFEAPKEIVLKLLERHDLGMILWFGATKHHPVANQQAWRNKTRANVEDLHPAANPGVISYSL